MAARQNQGFLIWIIVLVIFSLVLALATFLSFTKALEYADLNSQNVADLKIQTALAKAHEIQNQVMKAMIGNMGESVSEIETNLNSQDALLNTLDSDKRASVAEVVNKSREVFAEYKKDMALLVSTGDANPNATYRGVFESFATALKRKNDDNHVLQNDFTRVQQEALAQVAAKESEVQQMKTQLATTQQDFENEKARHLEDVNSFKTTMDNVNFENNSKNEDFGRVRSAWELLETQLNSAMTILTKDNETLKVKVDQYEAENFDRADGIIVSVADSLEMVVINRGSADGLRLNRSFAVYSQGTTNFVKDRHKATIEVIRIAGPKTAEARITLEDPRNPILTNDLILAAAWDPGNSVEIALAGIFDIDYDGKDDRDKLIQEIEYNGGKVVAWHDDDGNIHGEITPSTRYFVQGDSQPPSLDFNTALAKAARELKQDALNKKIQIIDSRKLMEWMGKSLSKPTIIPLDDRMGDPFRRSEDAEAARKEAELRFNDGAIKQ